MSRHEEIIDRLPEGTIGVIGDMVADVYVMGFPDRLSREAPVMVVRFEEERLIPGCAANSMNNLLALGCRIVPISLVGRDHYGRRLMDYLREHDVPLDGIIQRDQVKTVSKTRILVGEPNRTKQQVSRIDREIEEEPPPGIEEEIIGLLERLDPLVDAWLVSDYDYYTCTERVAGALKKLTVNKPLVVDSRYRIRLFKGARCMTPNESEAIEAAGMPVKSDADLEALGRWLIEETGTEALVITRGNLGMTVFEKNRPSVRLPTMGEDEAVDVTGAGDTVASTLTAALVAGATTLEAAELASCAAGVVVMKTGAATCSLHELKRQLPHIGHSG